jgi:hypothetical protein
MLQHNVGFSNGCITKRTKRLFAQLYKCVHTMILFHDCSVMKDEINNKSNVLCHFLNYIDFPMKRKLVSTKSCDVVVAKSTVM